MRMEDLFIRGISHIEDQAIVFYNGRVINLLQMRTIGHLEQTVAAPNPNDGDDNDDKMNRQSHRLFNRGAHVPPPPPCPPPPQNLGGHGPPLSFRPPLPPNQDGDEQ